MQTTRDADADTDADADADKTVTATAAADATTRIAHRITENGKNSKTKSKSREVA